MIIVIVFGFIEYTVYCMDKLFSVASRVIMIMIKDGQAEKTK